VEPSLLRIDDRLLHGQVLVAWAAAMHPDRLVLASDEVASDPERRAVYAALPQEDYEISIDTLAQAAARLKHGDRVLVVCGSPADARRLVDLGAGVRHIQVGGLHHAAGKRELLPYVHLSAADVEHLRALLERGIEIEARDLPGSRGVRLDAGGLDRLGV
jgi:mannose/fructose/N-acetylgalactosamine-specific phosphotransferase system component IIB